jgi:aminoglycoside phosphotransferase (APT) family kinase protein
MAPIDDLLAPESAVRIDQVCDRFEADWKAGRKPRIEAYLTGLTEADRSEVLRELLHLDMAYRSKNGELVFADDYEKRFPELTDRIKEAFLEWSGDSSGSANTVALRKPSGKTDTDRIPTPFIGKYRVVDRVGGGGQGEVFRAVHPHLPGRDVVIKWANARLPEAGRDQLLTEARALAKVEDPGLVRVYDVDVFEGRPFVVFEYVAGQSLEQRLRLGRPTVREPVQLVRQLARTLERVHRHGICHRDVKPGNILIDAAGQPRLVDFGLALTHGEHDPLADTVCGTLPYMPPEQANGLSDRIGPRSDVFGLGAVLYQLLTGRPPYQGPDRRAIWEQARQGKVAPARQVNPDLPRALDAICQKALAFDSAARYASASKFEQALARYLKRPVWVGALAAAAVLLILAAVAAGAFGLFSPPQPSRSEATSAVEQLSGELLLQVWAPGEGRRGTPVDERVTVYSGEKVHVEARLSRPAYVYLVWIGGDGKVQPLYPWDPEAGFARTESQQPRQVLHSPSERDRGWVVEGPSGVESVLLLARATPLPADVDLEKLIGKLPATPLKSEVAAAGEIKTRSVRSKAELIDEPMLQLLERLRPHFELVRVARFPHIRE